MEITDEKAGTKILYAIVWKGENSRVNKYTISKELLDAWKGN